MLSKAFCTVVWHGYALHFEIPAPSNLTVTCRHQTLCSFWFDNIKKKKSKANRTFFLFVFTLCFAFISTFVYEACPNCFLLAVLWLTLLVASFSPLQREMLFKGIQLSSTHGMGYRIPAQGRVQWLRSVNHCGTTHLPGTDCEEKRSAQRPSSGPTHS